MARVKMKGRQSTSKIRYFAVEPWKINKHKAKLITDDDCSHLAYISCIVYPYPTDKGLYIIKTYLNTSMVQDMSQHCADYGVEDPLTTSGVIALKIIKSFAGRTREDVLAKYPELADKVEIETEEGIVEVDKFPVKMWAFEGLNF